ncbi:MULTISPECIES: NUDIX hydrolase [Bacillaceae]|jgi:ADP-ribose pyrophosphatase YjhB (NUDIX family)|uniref:Putative ADP-ribose pyrophosphatase YjhB n=1 Tax=Caldibacillus thermoamylovorans TaxID=35841 RepID=A0A090IX15_9BACI|nr:MULTISPECIES: NUDIX hydrolase [Bacillaceae]MCB5936090.1 NUDIX hydrolase [Bacillus sp. DFI.2.34]AWI13434.1 ADP-ribose pyrophosphatase [Caldibacillus thermoamylovorans]MBU5342203.1 NUDIX hydrolase [Caldifermentibacillus hisashii]MCB7077439.1 NUDIX hydrolase [Caldibacillus thermoamylovorans]MCM3053593.1 NUDIX hydrolase [Caldibacillus thermoamylovorans]
MEPKWLEWAKELQSIAQAGLTYSRDVYDLERFEQIREISMEIMSQYTKVDQSVLKNLFANETGYPTPKVDIRAVIFEDNKILLVKENSDDSWSLPGGWADIGLTPSEVAIKEVKEESGFDVKPVKLLGVLDKKCHPHPPSPYHVYKIFIQCEIIGGGPQTGIETTAVGFFAENELPKLSEGRNTRSQIEMLFRQVNNPQEPVYFD